MQQEHFDLLIRRAGIIDGTNTPAESRPLNAEDAEARRTRRRGQS
jgi:hypothetical protein